MVKCNVCKVNPEVKYRCPSCLIRYCSKLCYAKHKGKCIPKVKSKSVVESSKGTITTKSNFQHEDLVPLDKLESLRHDKNLHELLKNPHLKNLLKTVNDSQHPEEIMQKAMQEPLFIEFADVCLKKLEPPLDD